MRRLAQALPLTGIVLETDAPDMPMAGAGAKGSLIDRTCLPRVLAVLAELRQGALI